MTAGRASPGHSTELGAPIWPPNPQTFAAPRRSRGAALEWFPSWGPDMAPKPPNVRSAPAQPWRCSGVVPVVGPRYGPQTPKRSQRPGAAVALLWSGSRRGAPIWPPTARSLWPEGEAAALGVAGAAGGGGGDPGDVGGQRPQAVDGLRQPRAYVVVQQDGDERAREGSYRGDSSRRSSPWMCSRRAGSGSIVSAVRRSASAPSWSPSSSREIARVASARASMAGADTDDGGGEAAGEAGGVAASVAGGGSGRAAVPMPGFGAGATVPAVVGWPTTGVAAATAGRASRPALRRIADFAHGSVSTSIACSQSFMAVSLCPISERAVPRLNHALADCGESS